jgi:hypothetical protein
MSERAWCCVESHVRGDRARAAYPRTVDVAAGETFKVNIGAIFWAPGLPAQKSLPWREEREREDG